MASSRSSVMAAPFVRQRRSDSLSMSARPVCPNKEMGRPTCRDSALPELYYCWVCQGAARHAGGLPPALNTQPANPGATLVLMGRGERVLRSASSPMWPSASNMDRAAYNAMVLRRIAE